MAVPDNVDVDELMLAMQRRLRQDTNSAAVLLDGMLHQAQGLGIPTNVVFLVVDSYLIELRKKLVEKFGKELVEQLEKGAEEAGKELWSLSAVEHERNHNRVPEDKPADKKESDTPPGYA